MSIGLSWHVLGMVFLAVFFYKVYEYCKKRIEATYAYEMKFSSLDARFKNDSLEEIEVWLWDGIHRGIHGNSKEIFRRDLQAYLDTKEKSFFDKEVLYKLTCYGFNLKN